MTLKFATHRRGGIWTTLDAINAALGVTRESQSEIYSVDKVL